MKQKEIMIGVLALLALLFFSNAATAKAAGTQKPDGYEPPAFGELPAGVFELDKH